MQKYTLLFRYLLPLSLVAFFPWLLLHFLSNPSCSSPPPAFHGGGPQHKHSFPVQLKAMVAGDLHLGGPTTSWLDKARRDAFMKASFKRAFETLEPDALLILGDISDWGRKSTEEQWSSVVRRFKDITKPFLGLPLHVIAGNHDIGDYYQLAPTLLQQFVASFPGLDDTGSAAFEIRNVSFVSVNAMALACETCPGYDSMKNAVERFREFDTRGSQSSFDGFQQANSYMHSTGNAFKRPVLLTHLPLYRADESVCDSVDIPKCAPWHEVEGGCASLFASAKNSSFHTPICYRNMMDMLSLNTSNYLLSALNPSLVLSAHAHRFCSRVHDNGAQEVTVSTFTWRNRDDPSFLLMYIYEDGTNDIQQCFLPRESFVLGLHVLQGFVLVVIIVLGGMRIRRVQRRARFHLKT